MYARDDLENSHVIARKTFSRLAAVSTAAAVAVIALLILRTPKDPLAQLGTSRRAVEARLTFFAHSPLSRERTETQRPTLREDAVLAELELALERERSVRNLHRFGAALLITGSARRARALLDEALRAAPNDAAVLVDLAAAELDLGHIADAAEHAAHALALDPEQPAAAFNWALGLEKLCNRPAAIEAWERYLRLDPDGEWSAEAKRHLSDLRVPRTGYEADRHLLSRGTDAVTIERLAQRYPQRARTRAHNVLLPAWVESGRVDDFAVLHAIGKVRADMGDPYILDIAQHAGNHRAKLAAGIHAYAEARKSEKDGRWDDAAAQFAKAANRLREAGSPLALGAEVYAASCELSSGRADEAMARLQIVEQELARSGNRYPCLIAEAAWIRGLLQARSGESDAALDAYRTAQAAARRAGEVEHETAIAELVASRMAAVAEPEEADRLRLDVLQRLDEIGAEPLRMFTAYQEMTFTSLRAGRPRVALAFAAVAARMAEKSGDSTGLTLTSARRALALHQVGKRDAALSALADARSHAMRIPSDGARDRALAEIDYTTGVLEMSRNPTRARQAFTAALNLWDRYGWRNHIAAGYLARGNAAFTDGDQAGAEADFRAGVAKMEHDRARIGEPLLRIAFFERSDALFDRLITLLLGQGRAEEALSVLERKRARFLLDQIGPGAEAAPLPARQIAERLPPGTAMLEIALLDERAELWLIRDGRIVHGRGRATRDAIEEAARRHVSAVKSGDEAAVRRTGRWLFDELIAPVGAHVRAEEKLVIIRDGALHMLPFTTLVTQTGEFLIDRHAVLEPASASVFLRMPATSTARTLFAVAQPSPEGFAPLPHAEREARLIAQSHPRGRFAGGRAVTPQEFLAEAATVGIVHYAGHAVADEEVPFRSSLVFDARDGALHLTAQMIGRSRLDSHPFVVLAACSTARGKSRRTEGVDSLAAAFLQAGARGVVATLWDIDDASSGRLFQTFHARLRDGASPADALRWTQRAFLHSTDPSERNPAIWGSVMLIATT